MDNRSPIGASLADRRQLQRNGTIRPKRRAPLSPARSEAIVSDYESIQNNSKIIGLQQTQSMLLFQLCAGESALRCPYPAATEREGFSG